MKFTSNVIYTCPLTTRRRKDSLFEAYCRIAVIWRYRTLLRMDSRLAQYVRAYHSTIPCNLDLSLNKTKRIFFEIYAYRLTRRDSLKFRHIDEQDEE